MGSRSLDDLQPVFRPLVDRFLASAKAAGLDVLVTCTLRPNDEQDRLYAQGRTAPGPIVTNARAGQSAHNYGYAIDIVPIRDGKCVWDGRDPLWHQIGTLGQAVGLDWYGAPDAKFREEPHFELPDWHLLVNPEVKP